MKTIYHYYDYDGLPTRLTLELPSGRVALAETYFPNEPIKGLIARPNCETPQTCSL